MEFIIPTFARKENPIGIYKIWFDDKWFYVGSSTRIKNRFSTWKGTLSSGIFKSINIRKILSEITTVRFEILETYKSASWLRRNEAKEINQHWDNPHFLNRCPDTNSPKGMKPYFGYVKPLPKRKGIPEYMQPIKVAVFNNDGGLIKVCKSKSEVEREFKFPLSLIKPVLLGKRGQPQKYKFKGVLDDGSFIEPPKYINKQKRWIPPCKPFIQMYPSGEFVARHESLRKAAKSAGCSVQLIQRLLKGRGRSKTAKGYIWEYA